jgi:hypothetical protein
VFKSLLPIVKVLIRGHFWLEPPCRSWRLTTWVDTKAVRVHLCGPGSYLTLCHRYLADSLGTRPRYLGDTVPVPA